VIASISGTEFSPEQWSALSYQDGNAYVAAGPGTGKTHLLVGRYLHLLDCGIARERIIVLTFSRRAADELRARIVAALADNGLPTVGVEVRTFHGFASRLLQGDGARFKTRRLLNGFTRELLFDAALESTELPSISASARKSRNFRAEAARLIDDIERAPADVVAAIAAGASPRLTDLLRLRTTFTASRDRLAASDLNDLVARATHALADQTSAAARWLAAHRYEHALVDEFQDTDIVQLDLLERLGAALFAVGDEAQSIYRFRGAQNGVISLATERFAMKRFALTVSRRCPPAVCELAAATPFVQAEALRSAHADGPPVAVHRVRTTADEVHLVADQVETALDRGTPASEIAVLLRTTRPFGPLLADELRRRAIPVAENERDALLSDSRVSTLKAAFDVFSDPTDAGAWRRLLTSQPLGFDQLAVRLQHTALGMFRPAPSLAGALDSAGLHSPVLSNPDLAAALANAKALWDRAELGRATRLLARRLRLLTSIMRDERPADVRAASARLKTLCDGLAEAQRALTLIGRPATCAQVVLALEEHLSALGGESAADSNAVRILSVHGAKGLEFDLVIIADAIDGRFPQGIRPSNLLPESDRALLSRYGVDGASISDAVEHEEASLWFVAVTRAKQTLVITYADEGLDGREQRPSRFLAGRTPHERTLVARGSLEIAALRNGDPAWRAQLRSERRIAASPVLSSYANEGDPAFSRLEERPLPLSRTFSVTDIVSWLQCPRKVFYGSFLGIRGEESTSLTLGNALHSVLQKFHATERDFRAVATGTAERWTTRLHELRQSVWATTDFEGSAIHESTGIFADRALASYARHLEARAIAAPFVVEGNETNVEVPIGPLTMRGRIDRIDRRVADDNTVLVDYKSGGSPKTSFRKELDQAGPTWEAGGSVAGRVDYTFTAQLALYASAFQHVGEFAYIYLRGSANDRSDIVVDSTTLDEVTEQRLNLLLTDVHANFSDPLVHGETKTLRPMKRGRDCEMCTYGAICPGGPEDNE
jgi:DNA helicase II / ATP-dependent DNA helicase PcrA